MSSATVFRLSAPQDVVITKLEVGFVSSGMSSTLAMDLILLTYPGNDQTKTATELLPARVPQGVPGVVEVAAPGLYLPAGTTAFLVLYGFADFVAVPDFNRNAFVTLKSVQAKAPLPGVCTWKFNNGGTASSLTFTGMGSDCASRSLTLSEPEYFCRYGDTVSLPAATLNSDGSGVLLHLRDDAACPTNTAVNSASAFIITATTSTQITHVELSGPGDGLDFDRFMVRLNVIPRGYDIYSDQGTTADAYVVPGVLVQNSVIGPPRVAFQGNGLYLPAGTKVAMSLIGFFRSGATAENTANNARLAVGGLVGRPPVPECVWQTHSPSQGDSISGIRGWGLGCTASMTMDLPSYPFCQFDEYTLNSTGGEVPVKNGPSPVLENTDFGVKLSVWASDDMVQQGLCSADWKTYTCPTDSLTINSTQAFFVSFSRAVKLTHVEIGAWGPAADTTVMWVFITDMEFYDPKAPELARMQATVHGAGILPTGAFTSGPHKGLKTGFRIPLTGTFAVRPFRKLRVNVLSSISGSPANYKTDAWVAIRGLAGIPMDPLSPPPAA
ncbi:hypothetical protein C2E20_2449 [Micractinium conductrix]|uniref:Uncharacterized protein n=1 Tax=Micractinium conductrix TaxID=554055 RepID=A0A2P6VK09_9CHLO|nr:hypothetical protein C2E20_2449 [Micractinium conductrix]|eukprot:PSC74425.1 hypothetical protein C2E20_2449 [Micractinium conductrix]